MGEQASDKVRSDFPGTEIRISLTDLVFWDGNPHDFSSYEAAEIKVAHEAIVVFVVLVRQFVFGIGFLVVAFWCPEFRGHVFHFMHRLEHDRKQYGCDGDEVEYGEFGFHGNKSRSCAVENFLFNNFF
jgi:hypothetical protein